MKLVTYDGTFSGLLAAVFEVYYYKIRDANIIGPAESQQSFFADILVSEANEVHAERVWQGLKKKISANAQSQVYRAFLSEQKGVENIILNYIRYVFSSNTSVEYDYSNASVLQVSQLAKKVYREKHRMEAFVRFQLTADELYYAVIEPDFNVLPILGRHFEERYADQKWMIYDSKRKFGLYYDLHSTSEVTMMFTEELEEGKSISAIYEAGEELYQQLWKAYFNSVNIAARKNMKLHIQHMPKRYWKYLPEKKL